MTFWVEIEHKLKGGFRVAKFTDLPPKLWKHNQAKYGGAIEDRFQLKPEFDAMSLDDLLAAWLKDKAQEIRAPAPPAAKREERVSYELWQQPRIKYANPAQSTMAHFERLVEKSRGAQPFVMKHHCE